MEQSLKTAETFVVKVRSKQNATWQGTVTYAEGKQTQCFRSLLELVRLMDSALPSAAEDTEVTATGSYTIT